MGEEVNVSVASRGDQASIKVYIDGFKFDLVPAPNFNQNQALQCEFAQERISNTTKSYLFSSALTEDVVKFVKDYTDTNKASGFLVKQFIRLVKLWNRTIYLGKDGYVSGKSYLFELIAIHIWKTHQNETLSRLFLHFLDQMKSFHSLRVCFNSGDMNSNSLGALKNSKDDRPIIQDPVNKMNDLGAGIDKDIVKIFETKATEWLIKLGEASNGADTRTLYSIGNENISKKDELLINQFVSAWRSAIISDPRLKISSSLLCRCEWLLDVRNRATFFMVINDQFLSRLNASPTSSNTRIRLLLLMLDLLLYRQPSLELARTKEDMEDAVKGLLANLFSRRELTMKSITIGSKKSSRPRGGWSTSETFTKLRQCTATMTVPSGTDTVNAVIGLRLLSSD